MEFDKSFSVKYRLFSGSAFGVSIVAFSLIFFSRQTEPFPLIHLFGATCVATALGWVCRIPGWKLAGFRVSPLVDLRAIAIEMGSMFVVAAPTLLLLGIAGI